MKEEDARAVIAKQATREERAKIADQVIDNSGDLESLQVQVDAVWQWAQHLPPATEDAGTRESKTSSNKDS
jgi:dephospho-CoA kinase